MTTSRIFTTVEFIQLSEEEPIRSIVTESPEAVVVMWCVLPGQQIQPHIHPTGQDTWVVLSGQGEYLLDQEGATQSIVPGQIAVAQVGQVHGVINRGQEPFLFVSIVVPQDAGFQPV
ncbi:cupin [Leptolyngbya sp. 'hensonii']|uniref:cupin domain-containing protein n=1 Tax=Leptolyngbya sp. 'hensonii' TaxID=1922337 RepID=UPI00094FE1A8|nr:cupin domain-containing protein [Leptolyngbya sp. 'hensonii']OLP16662.1 cupin [Leptolyngbya sp. 'hensonii']